MNGFDLDQFIESALAEDIGDGDHSSLACVPLNLNGKAHLLIKESGILAGVKVGISVFKKVDPHLNVTVFIPDGSKLNLAMLHLSLKGPGNQF